MRLITQCCCGSCFGTLKTNRWCTRLTYQVQKETWSVTITFWAKPSWACQEGCCIIALGDDEQTDLEMRVCFAASGLFKLPFFCRLCFCCVMAILNIQVKAPRQIRAYQMILRLLATLSQYHARPRDDELHPSFYIQSIHPPCWLFKTIPILLRLRVCLFLCVDLL